MSESKNKSSSKKIKVNDLMQSNYSYYIVQPKGKYSASKGYVVFKDNPDFTPELSPEKMLRLGVFEGKYLNDCKKEFPKKWWDKAKVVKVGDDPDISLNYFGIKSRLSLQEWKRKKWITKQDPRGWFQWYCRYFMGRRTDEDGYQIKRWKAFVRHIAQIKKNCHHKKVKDKHGNFVCSIPQECRPKQRQAILQWAYNPIRL